MLIFIVVLPEIGQNIIDSLLKSLTILFYILLNEEMPMFYASKLTNLTGKFSPTPIPSTTMY
jgi:hypothetical protein